MWQNSLFYIPPKAIVCAKSSQKNCWLTCFQSYKRPCCMYDCVFHEIFLSFWWQKRLIVFHNNTENNKVFFQLFLALSDGIYLVLKEEVLKILSWWKLSKVVKKVFSAKCIIDYKIFPWRNFVSLCHYYN